METRIERLCGMAGLRMLGRCLLIRQTKLNSAGAAALV